MHETYAHQNLLQIHPIHPNCLLSKLRSIDVCLLDVANDCKFSTLVILYPKMSVGFGLSLALDTKNNLDKSE